MTGGNGTEARGAGREGRGPVAIERWWPHLSIDSKHRLLEDLTADIDDQTAAEIESITGAAAPERLSAAEQRFVRTQIEPVD